jgi:Ca-activated chloride channel homolog
MPPMIPGKRLAPKIKMMMNRMTSSSGRPSPIDGHCITFAVAALLAGTAAVRVAHGQFASGVNAVEVYVSVTDARGEPVKGLTKGDFEVREDGSPQEISTFTAGNLPLSVAVAIDRSFSMAGPQLTLAKTAARAFLGELRPADESMILAVGSTVDVLAPLSAERQPQFEALSRLDAFGTTGLHDAIIDAIDAVQPAKGRRALVLLSDGNDRYSRATAGEALQAARASDVMIYPVALGETRPPLFAELATLTGGRSFHARDPKTLPATLRAIAQELREQYLLGYTPARAIVTGTNEWRSIEVVVRRPNVQVRARDGYLVK